MLPDGAFYRPAEAVEAVEASWPTARSPGVPARLRLFCVSDQALQAEREENERRKNLRRSEMVALGRKIEEREKLIDEARLPEVRRKAGGTRRGEQEIDPISCSRGSVRVRVGKALDVGADTYSNAKKVMIAAEAEPEKYADLVENMDETATVVRVPQKKRTAARQESRWVRTPSWQAIPPWFASSGLELAESFLLFKPVDQTFLLETPLARDLVAGEPPLARHPVDRGLV